MPHVLIVGYGNPLRGDDGLGWTIAAELFRKNQSPDLEIIPCHQLTPELASSMQAVETVIFIDCAREGSAGEFRRVEVQPDEGCTSFTHDLTPAKLLSLTCELFGACPRTYLLSIRGSCFEAGEGLSPEVSAKVPQLKATLWRLIEQAHAPSTAG